MRKTIPASIIILLLMIDAFAAASLSDYRRRVSQAEEEVDALIEKHYADAEDIASIKTLLPRSEQVDLAGQTVGVDNAWLHTLLDSARNATRADERENKLSEASGRLFALGEHLDRIQSQALGAEGSNATREKLREIRSRKEFMVKGDDPITAFIKKARNKVFEVLNKIYSKVLEVLFGGNSGASWVYRGLVIAGLVGALVMALRMFRRFKRAPKKREKKRTVLGEEIEAGTTSNDLAEAALRAAKAGDFRSAVRKLYISLLYELSERNLIELEPNTTNHEYLAKVSRFQPLVAPMRFLTDRFDYTWYGMFPSSAEDFSTFRARYDEAMDRVRNLNEQSAKA
jgi:hypothetical protein